jgi:hypothetical protein
MTPPLHRAARREISADEKQVKFQQRYEKRYGLASEVVLQLGNRRGDGRDN